MTTDSAKEIRNFAIVGHASCGKTMLSEAMLACSGVIGRMGRIADGSTVSDYHPSEKQRQISTQTSLLHATWAGKKFNIMDSPGYLDFAGEALSALHVADMALVVIHARDGVGVGTERMWNYASELGLPKIIVVNLLDKLAGDFDEKLATLRERYGAGLFPLSLPVNAGAGFNQVLDVMRGELVTYDISDGHGKFREEPAEGALKETVARPAS
jgi:elongation factor G